MFGREAELGRRVVVIGGGEIGVETGLYLARCGHIVHILEMKAELAADAAPLHYRDMFKAEWENTDHLTWTTQARVTEIRDGKVRFACPDGKEGEVAFDTLVLAVGTAANAEEAMGFYGAAREFHMIGNCVVPGGLNVVNRNTYFTCTRI